MSANEIESLLFLLSKLPGLGPRSAKRILLYLLKNKDFLLDPLIEALSKMRNNIITCSLCGNIDITSPCNICSNIERQNLSQVCVVEEVADLWAIERSSVFRGTYHVLGGTLSAMEGKNPGDLNIESLVKKVAANSNIEIILATNATIDGQTTAYYIAERLKNYGVKISRLAQGIPIGGELDYLDEGTLGEALKMRHGM